MISREKQEIKELNKEADGMSKSLQKSRKAYDDNLKVDASAEDLRIMEEIKFLKKKHAELLKDKSSSV